MSASPRERLLDLLGVAAELEHGLCLQYLFTAASIKDSLAEGGLTLAELTATRTWKANLYFVAAQEMLHLVQVANLAAAVGGAVNLHRPNFPQRPGYYPTDLPWGLWPFALDTTALYACYERPTDAPPMPGPWTSDDLAVDARGELDPFGHLPSRFARPRATSHETIAQLYGEIEGLVDEPAMIVGDPSDQIPGVLVDLPDLVEVTDRASANAAIERIVAQGEGAPLDRADSHYGIFVAMHREHRRLAGERPDFAPARDVQANPLSRLHVDNTYPGWRLIEDPAACEVNDLCSALYRLLLDLLADVFAAGTPAPERGTHAQAALRLMTAGVKPLGDLLTTMPMGDPSPRRARYAGASFEMDSAPAPAGPHAAERIAALAAWTRRIAGVATPAAPVLTALADTLTDIGAAMAQG